MKRIIYLADCQSFYASVEKVAHPEYKNKPLVVAGDPERRSGIILAACPIAKGYGVSTAERLWEALKKCPDLIVIKPRMQQYINVSMQITEIYEQYTDLVEPFSIDEQFMDVTNSFQYFKLGPEELAASIQKRVLAETGIYTRFGISTTKVLAKTACDNFAKKNKSGVYTLRKEELESTLWQLPIDKMYMVGSRMTDHLTKAGIQTIGDLAKMPLDKFKAVMRKRMGKQANIHAEVLWRIANGIDDSPVSPGTHGEGVKSVGHQMTLPRDYRNVEEISVVLLELTELVCRRCRGKGYMGAVISVGCQGADFDRPTGFYRQMKMPDATSVTDDVFAFVMRLFRQHWDGLPVRKVGVSLSDLVDDDQYQLSLFTDRERKMQLEKTTDNLKDRYGDAVILRASSLIENVGQAKRRSSMIGGHYK